jgi:DNA gyrase/topoisomerase IV subunit A
MTELCSDVMTKMKRVLLEEQKIEETIQTLTNESFTVLDFIETLKEIYPDCWKRLVERFGQFGDKRRYTVNTYLSNRLDLYSQKPNSLLEPFARYRQEKFKDYRRTTLEEKKVFGSPWIAVFKKKKRTKRY